MFMNVFDQLPKSISADGDVLMLDIGKTYTKLIRHLVSPKNAAAAKNTPDLIARMPSPTLYGPPYPSIDTDSIFAWLGAQITAFPDTDAVAAILPITHGAAFALLDEAGTLTMPVMDYEYRPSPELAAQYDADRPRFAETGSPRMDAMLNAGQQIYYQQTMLPEVFADVRSIVPLAQYFGHLLGGRLHSELSALGCHTDLWSPQEATPSSLAMDRGWAERFPPMAHGLAPVGTLRSDLAETWGLQADTKILAGCHDSSFERAVLANRCAADFASISTGTWFVVTTPCAGSPDLEKIQGASLGVTLDGKATVSARFMGGRMMEAFTGGCSWNDVERVLKTKTIVISDDLACKSSTPSASMFMGPPAQDSAVHRAAMMLHIILITDQMLTLLQAPKDVLITGPFSDDPLFMELLILARQIDNSANTVKARTSAKCVPSSPRDLPTLAAYRSFWREQRQ